MTSHIQVVSDNSKQGSDGFSSYLLMAAKIVETVAFEIAQQAPANTVEEILTLASQIEKAGLALRERV
ncbi:hypothetical protein [uncultured Sulfitobacter sp.]|uniref:hypothetical protein n=1 Tax=uncultured Sulfitobacter sp. TaxID=191468 RepID=UPI00261642CE|nr:hypothetical protein [uncultured Sulfitobacter sp.]